MVVPALFMSREEELMPNVKKEATEVHFEIQYQCIDQRTFTPRYHSAMTACRVFPRRLTSGGRLAFFHRGAGGPPEAVCLSPLNLFRKQ